MDDLTDDRPLTAVEK